MSLRDQLRDVLSESERALVPTAFDIIGNKDKAVAIIEIPDALAAKKRAIARALMQQHKNVKTVLEKGSPRQGVYRTRALSILAGSSDTDVIHAESGCRFFVDPKTSYFSPRESAERLRIAERVTPGETVMVFFAGVGPFAILIAKKTRAKEVIGIELNPDAAHAFEHNVLLNKVSHVTVIAGNVKTASTPFHGRCDRVLMPLPESSFDFLDDALRCLKPGGTCHMYCFSTADELIGKRQQIKACAAKQNRPISFQGTKNVLPYGPNIWKVRIDFVVR